MILKKLKKSFVIYPFLFAIFPILFLFAYNIDEVPAKDLLLPMLVVIIGTLMLFFSLRLITKNYHKIGIVTSSFLVLFFSYGHIRDLTSALEIGGFSIGSVFFLGSLWALLFITGAFMLIRSRRDFSTSTKFLNIVAITLVVISLVNISIYEIKTTSPSQERIREEGTNLYLKKPDSLPDIYYIILDGYARSDTLEQIYNYDNSKFINYLTNKGFYIASKSRSNYSHTFLSLASSLNMEYVNYLSNTVGIESKDRTIPYEMIANNQVSHLLEAGGYRFIYIVSSSWVIKDMEPYNMPTRFGIRMSNFASYLIQTTALAPFTSFFIGHDTRNAILDAFDTLADIPDIKEPTFVFAHILSPHPPYVFDRSGNPVKQDVFKVRGDVWQNKEGYIEQLIFINKKVETLIHEILSKSDVEPIIILQADHGTASTGQFECPYSELTKIQTDERMNIFNAYYLPDNGQRLLYESITPVNSFRILFNLYFGSNYGLLKDESYFSNNEHPYKFILVPPGNNYE